MIKDQSDLWARRSEAEGFYLSVQLDMSDQEANAILTQICEAFTLFPVAAQQVNWSKPC